MKQGVEDETTISLGVEDQDLGVISSQRVLITNALNWNCGDKGALKEELYPT